MDSSLHLQIRITFWIAEDRRMSAASNVPKGARLSQHLDVEAQLEVFQLKQKLQEMTEVVQQLLQHMNLLEKTPVSLFVKGRPPQTDSVATQTSPLEGPSFETSEKLRDKLKELVNMNISWQKYNTLQDQHIQTLNDKVEDMQSKLKESQLSHERQTIEWKRTNDYLRMENEQLKARMEKLKPGEESFQTPDKEKSTKSEGKREFSERERILEAQAMIYKEDFEIERRDRVKAQARIEELEQEMQELKKTTSNPHHFNHSIPGVRRNTWDISPPAYDEVDGQSSDNNFPDGRFQVATGKSQNDSRVHNGTDDDILCCPKCFKAFTRNEHLELLEHCERCSDC